MQVEAGPWDSVRDKIKRRMRGNWKLVRIYSDGDFVIPIGITDAEHYIFCFVAEQHLAHFRELERAELPPRKLEVRNA
jgi:hypothetical protein